MGLVENILMEEAEMLGGDDLLLYNIAHQISMNDSIIFDFKTVDRLTSRVEMMLKREAREQIEDDS